MNIKTNIKYEWTLSYFTLIRNHWFKPLFAFLVYYIMLFILPYEFWAHFCFYLFNYFCIFDLYSKYNCFYSISCLSLDLGGKRLKWKKKINFCFYNIILALMMINMLGQNIGKLKVYKYMKWKNNYILVQTSSYNNDNVY